MLPQSRSLGSTCHCKNTALRKGQSCQRDWLLAAPEQLSARHITCCTRGANDEGALSGCIQDRSPMVEDQEADADGCAHRLAGVDDTVYQTNPAELLPCMHRR